MKRILIAAAVWLFGCAGALAQNADIFIVGTIATANPTGTVNFNVNGQGTVGVSIQGSFTGSMVIEGSVDGINYATVPAVQLGSGTPISTVTAPIIGQVNSVGLETLRVRGTALSVGSATVTLHGSSGGVGIPIAVTPTNAVGSGTAGYPPGTTPLTNSASGTTGAVAATLTPVAGTYAYLCGIYVTGTTSTAANATTVTISGITQSSLSLLVQHPVTPSLGALSPPAFTPCLRGSATGGAIAVQSAADAAGSNVTVNAWGYQQ